jgi:acetate kinase
LRILTLNNGSSSLKFALYDVRRAHPTEGGLCELPCERLRHGSIEGIGRSPGSIRVSQRGGDGRTIEAAIPDRQAALRWLVAELDRDGTWNQLTAVGHRFVHGGLSFREPVLVTRDVRDAIEKLVPLAPAHLPGELAALDAIAHARPSLPQVACFDTAFHADLPREARLFGIPRRLAEAGIVRYGFHGLSYEYVTSTLGARGQLGARTVVAHLGNGASMAAIADGKCVDTSMGFTPAGGFVMSTRSGDIDPGVLLYLLEERRMSVAEVEALVRSTGGLLGLSETASDMRDLLARAASDERAADAVAVFCYQVRKFLGAYVAVLHGLDTLVFTGGIGENAAEIRARVCASLDCFGIELDPDANAAGAPIISRDGASVTVHVVHTDEESVIARQTLRVLRQSAGADHD